MGATLDTCNFMSTKMCLMCTQCGCVSKDRASNSEWLRCFTQQSRDYTDPVKNEKREDLCLVTQYKPSNGSISNTVLKNTSGKHLRRLSSTTESEKSSCPIANSVNATR